MTAKPKEVRMSLITAFVMVAALYAAISLFNGVASMARQRRGRG